MLPTCSPALPFPLRPLPGALGRCRNHSRSAAEIPAAAAAELAFAGQCRSEACLPDECGHHPDAVRASAQAWSLPKQNFPSAGRYQHNRHHSLWQRLPKTRTTRSTAAFCKLPLFDLGNGGFGSTSASTPTTTNASTTTQILMKGR